VATGLEPQRTSTQQTTQSDISLYELLTPLVRGWKLIVGSALVCATLAAIFLLLQRPIFTAQASFTPESSGNSGLSSSIVGLAGLAGQLGLGGMSAPTVSPEFFARLLHSREVLRSTLLTEFPDPNSANGTKRPLLDLFEAEGENSEERLQMGARLLEQVTAANIDKPTGIVNLEVEMHSPELAANIANRMLELLNQFNLERRQSQSREQARFTGDRLKEAEEELREAERAQLRFLQANRQYQGSPLLEFQAAQLDRVVQLKQEVFLTLTKAYEEARIAEVRDTPVLTVIDSAVAPVKRTGPRRTLGTLVALIVGGALGVLLAYLASARAKTRRAPSPDYLEFRAALEEARRTAPRG
jgi:tyrosine-protein kinase Etk/Wzc